VPPPSIDPDGPGPQGTDTAPLFCSGVSMLASGEVLVTGGTLVYPEQYEDDPYTAFSGINRVFTFNPFTKAWTEQPQMNAGRWYPGQVELADGRTVILSGFTEQPPGGIVNRDLEVFTPASQPGGVGSLSLQPSGERRTALYPHLFTLPNSTVLLAGPVRNDSAVLQTSTFTWQDKPRPIRARLGGSAILNPGPPAGAWTVTQIGGYDLGVTDPQGGHPATATTETFNANPNVTGGWKPGPRLNLPRSYQNTLLLPDRSMVAVGGGIGTTVADNKYAIDPEGKQRQVELYDPATKQWRLGPAEVEDRGYHSTALLLPNGKVWSAGDNKHPVELDGGFALTDTAELYSPPYMFKGPRPLITSAPSQVTWGQAFSAHFDTARPSVESAVLIAPGSTTHGDDSNQRLVTLRVQGTASNRIDLVAPPTAGVAPPGYYMLFGLHQGVPSVAKWVHIG
jgi:galactose oxidase-like protein